MDCFQSGHLDIHPLSQMQQLTWQGSSSYDGVRKMYKNPLPSGHPRPVIDLEPHYEATHYAFNVSPTIAISSLWLIFSPKHLFGRLPICVMVHIKQYLPGKFFLPDMGRADETALVDTYTAAIRSGKCLQAKKHPTVCQS